ncbi:MAG: hypothetical protein NT027_07135 [Proteobacteria bacterium]|nr:hypothetical protein [Pseudomonadota bacterium]
MKIKMQNNPSMVSDVAKHFQSETHSRLGIHLVRPLSILALLLAPLNACTETTMKSKATDQRSALAQLAATTDSAGNITGDIDPSSGVTQVLKSTSGKFAGAAVALPVGALSIPISITIGEGESLASASTISQIGLSGNSASAAGPSVSFIPSSSVEAANPFTLSIPMSISTSLAESDTVNSNPENLVVMYKWMKVENNNVTYLVGIIPRKDLSVSAKGVQFQSTKFGTFQLAYTAVKVTEKINQQTGEPPVLKQDAGNPLVGVWGICRSDKNDEDNNYVEPTYSNVGVACNMAQGLVPYSSIGNASAPKLKIQFASDYISDSASDSIKITHIQNGGTTSSITQSVSDSFFPAPDKSRGVFARPSSVTNSLATEDKFLISAEGRCRFVDASNGNTFKTIAYTNTVPMLTSLQGTASYNTSQITFTNAISESLLNAPISASSSPIYPMTAGLLFYVNFVDTATMRINVRNLSGAEISLAASPATTYINSYCGVMTVNARLECKDNWGDNHNGYDPSQSIERIGAPDTATLTFKETVRFSRDRYVFSKSSFSSPSCAGTPINRYEETGKFAIGTKESDNVYPATITMETQKAAVFGPIARAIANNNSHCGITDWLDSKQRDLSVTSCNQSNTGGPEKFKIQDNKIFFFKDGAFSNDDYMNRE